MADAADPPGPVHHRHRGLRKAPAYVAPYTLRMHASHSSCCPWITMPVEPKHARRRCGPCTASSRSRSIMSGVVSLPAAADTARDGVADPASAPLTTANDHKRGTVRDAPRPGRAGCAVVAVSSRGYHKEPRRCLRPRRRGPAACTSLRPTSRGARRRAPCPCRRASRALRRSRGTPGAARWPRRRPGRGTGSRRGRGAAIALAGRGVADARAGPGRRRARKPGEHTPNDRLSNKSGSRRKNGRRPSSRSMAM